MSESELNTYKLQLQQVEAALTTDPDNEVRQKYFNPKRCINIFYNILGAVNSERRFGASYQSDT